MSVQVTIASGPNMERVTFDDGWTARYERVVDGSHFATLYPRLCPEYLLVRDVHGRVLATYPKRDVLGVYAPCDP